LALLLLPPLPPRSRVLLLLLLPRCRVLLLPPPPLARDRLAQVLCRLPPHQGLCASGQPAWR
jgi:hypothetical protein